MPTMNWSLQNKMPTFPPLSANDPIREVIKQAFDMALPVEGGWGYTEEDALILHADSSMPLKQLQHTLASMRTHLEMSMTRPEEERYGGINLTEECRETDTAYQKVTYRVTAMLESDYAAFIAAYKAGYGTEDFDMEAHFHARKEATYRRNITVWFQTQDQDARSVPL